MRAEHQPPGQLPEGATTFQVPTYVWDGGSGMDAEVEGHLAFTNDGCTMLYEPGRENMTRPVVFPNATGIRYGNGMRAVMGNRGNVYAVEGQPFSYGGGWVSPDTSWTSACGPYDGPEVAMVNDEPGLAPPQTDPELPFGDAVPTRLATAADLGWFDVPTFEWDPADGGESALLQGEVTITHDGCAVIEHDDTVTGLVLPNSRGHRGDYPGGAVIRATFPDGETTIAEQEAGAAAYTGAHRDDRGALGDEWARLCPDSPVDDLFQVYDTDPWT